MNSNKQQNSRTRVFFLSIFSVNELLKAKEDLTKERDEKLEEIAKLRENLSEAGQKQQMAEKDRDEAATKIAEVLLRMLS